MSVLLSSNFENSVLECKYTSNQLDTLYATIISQASQEILAHLSASISCTALLIWVRRYVDGETKYLHG